MSEKYKKVCRVFNYIDHLLIVFFTITGCVSISAFDFLVGIPIVITSSAMGLKNCALTPGIKKHKLIIKRQKKKGDKIVLLAKSKLNSIEVLISKALFDSNINQGEFVLVNNVFKEFNDMKEESKTQITNKSLNYI